MAAKKKVSKKKVAKKKAKKKTTKKKILVKAKQPLGIENTQELIPAVNLGGAPVKYRPEMGAKVIEAMGKGFSKEAAAASIGIVKDTFYRWVKKYPEFKEAVEVGEQASILFWEKLGILGAAGKVPNFNSTAWIFNMKNRAGWVDKKEITGKGGGAIDHKYTIEVVKPDPEKLIKEIN